MNSREDYYYLPKKHRKKHDYCEFVINQVEALITDETFIELKTQSIPLPKEFLAVLNSSDEHLLDLLKKHDYIDELNHIIRTNLIYSLIMETCYFIQESLLCSLKRRMTVCFTLLRKPFLEISILLMRILQEDDFIDKFNNLENFDPIKTTQDQKRELVNRTNALFFDKYPENEIYDYIFNKNFGDSLYNLTNNAIHLYTDRNPISATKKQNLNFIFSDRQDVEMQWEHIYEALPMLITFMADLIDLLSLKSTTVGQAIFMKRIKERDKLKRKNKVE